MIKNKMTGLDNICRLQIRSLITNLHRSFILSQFMHGNEICTLGCISNNTDKYTANKSTYANKQCLKIRYCVNVKYCWK